MWYVRRIVLVLVVAALCSGQNCSAPPAPAPAEVQTNIPAGDYVGTISLTLAGYRNDEKTGEDTAMSNPDYTFGADGVPLANPSQYWATGLGTTQTVGSVTIQSTITALNVIENGDGLEIVSTIVLQSPTSEGGTVTFNGTMVETFILQSDSTLEYTLDLEASTMSNGDDIRIEMDGTAILS